MRLLLSLGFLFLASMSPAYAVTVTYTDVIATPDRFNGFEGLPGSLTYGSSYSFDGIEVTQVNGDANAIATIHNPGGLEGSRGWYPWGGDHGYTKITLAGGEAFSDVGMLIGSGGNGFAAALYILLNGGVEVLSGQVDFQREFHYLGFLGGGFDTILLRDTRGLNGLDFFDGSENALSLDSIEVGMASVPLPGALPLLGSALLALAVWPRRRRESDQRDLARPPLPAAV